jgi:hypothetical protein
VNSAGTAGAKERAREQITREQTIVESVRNQNL